MRKLIHKVGWLTQSHVHQSTAQEYMPFQFQRLCFFCYSALNPSVGVRKKLAPSFTQMNVLLASAGCSQCFLVFFFFLLSLPILVILSIKLSQLPLRTEIFLFLPQGVAGQGNHSFSWQVSDHQPRIGLSTGRCQKTRGTETTWWLSWGRGTKVPPWSLKGVFLSNAPICFQLSVQRCNTAKWHQYMHMRIDTSEESLTGIKQKS